MVRRLPSVWFAFLIGCSSSGGTAGNGPGDTGTADGGSDAVLSGDAASDPDAGVDDVMDPGDASPVPFDTDEGVGVAEVLPTTVNFGAVGGQTATRDVQVVNTGTGPLRVLGFKLTGHPDFRFGYAEPGAEPLVASPSDQAVDFGTPFELAPAGKQTFELSFTTETTGQADGVLTLYTDGPTPVHTVTLLANVSGPCLMVTPSSLSFGPTSLGGMASLSVLLEACGPVATTVSSVTITDDATGAFGLNVGDVPLTVTPGAKVPVTVTYTPQGAAAVVDGVPQPDTARLTLVSDAPASPTQVPLDGAGVAAGCPTAAGKTGEGAEVVAQTLIHLVSLETDDIVNRQWTVSAPPGATGTFVPSATVANPTFQVDVPGTYEFSLDVWNAAGVKSCAPWTTTVLVVEDEAIRVELTWETPGDPNLSDTKGADLDLHFAHAAKAVNTTYDGDQDGKNDPWFDVVYDVFWMNVQPSWGADPQSDADDPVLLFDSSNGKGPEIVALREPEDGANYLVGVHDDNDWGLGASKATVRIWINQVLAAEYPGVELSRLDMWCVANIAWPSGVVSPCKPGQATPAITPNYDPPM